MDIPRRVSWLLNFAICCLLLAPLQSFGQTNQTYSKEVRALYAQGHKLVVQKSFKEAITKFTAALLLHQQTQLSKLTPLQQATHHKQTIGLLYVLARTYHYQKNRKKAYKTYRDCLQLQPSKKVRSLIKKYIQKLKPHLQKNLSMSSQPQHASFTLLDRWKRQIKGTLPFKKRVFVGTYQLTLSLKGHKQITRTIEILENKRSTLVFTFYKMVPDKQPPKKRRITPKKKVAPLPVTQKARPLSKTKLAWVWVSFGFSLAFLTAGTIVGGISIDQSMTYNKEAARMENRQKASELYKLSQRAKSTGEASIILFALSAGAIAASLLIILGKTEQESIDTNNKRGFIPTGNQRIKLLYATE